MSNKTISVVSILPLISMLLFFGNAYAYISSVSISSWPGSLSMEIGGSSNNVSIGIFATGNSSETVEVSYFLSDTNSLSPNCGHRIHLKKANFTISPGHNYGLSTTIAIPETHPNAIPNGNIYQYGPYEYILAVVTVGSFDLCDNYDHFGGAKDMKAIPVSLTGGNYTCYEGYLSGTGDYQVEPDGSWFYHDTSGTYVGSLSGSGNTRLSKNAVFWPNSLPSFWPRSYHIGMPKIAGFWARTRRSKKWARPMGCFGRPRAIQILISTYLNGLEIASSW